MGQIFGEYTLVAVQNIIGGYRLQPDRGAADGDFVIFEPVEDDIEVTTGAGGFSVYSDNGNDAIIATYRVFQNSPVFRILSDLRTAQVRRRKNGNPMRPLNFRFSEPFSGNRLSSQHAVFLNRPALGFGKSVGETEFRLHLPKPKIVYGANITI
ncbi:MAG: hypothetical protein AAFV53_35305 [Myxococcota bacterium]